MKWMQIDEVPAKKINRKSIYDDIIDAIATAKKIRLTEIGEGTMDEAETYKTGLLARAKKRGFNFTGHTDVVDGEVVLYLYEKE